MIHPPRPRCRLALAIVMALCAAFPARGWTWGWATHHYIAQHYSQHLPSYMDGLRAYDSIVDAKVTDPDERRSYTPGEAERHYIDIDFYPEFFTGTLSHDRATLEAQYGAATVIDVGILPWAVGEVTATLTAQFQAQQWTDAATTIADLCHYVGDAAQPLHCTMNYNGQITGNNGIHSRYETTMMSPHIGELLTLPTAVTFYPNPVDALFDFVGDSWPGVSTVIQADDDAVSASGGPYNSTYYASLWSSTESLTRGRINAATVATASFVYTAWVNAGQPTIPGSTADVGSGPVAARLAASPTPFRDALTIQYAGEGPLSVDVFDVRGARVARVVEGATGASSTLWRPTVGAGPGIYFIRLTGPGVNIVRRVTRLE